MPEPITKRLAVTFSDGLPLGTHGSFKHDGQTWIAYPAKKDARIMSVIDRMLGIFSRITADALRSINAHPDNPDLCALAASIVGSAGRGTKLAAEKGRALTS